ncbi:hypothetical protein PMAYCL1PPCAC_19925, partial [Pristionchus mayeri]
QSKPTSLRRVDGDPAPAEPAPAPEKKEKKTPPESDGKEYDALAKTEGLGVGSKEVIDFPSSMTSSIDPLQKESAEVTDRTEEKTNYNIVDLSKDDKTDKE